MATRTRTTVTQRDLDKVLAAMKTAFKAYFSDADGNVTTGWVDGWNGPVALHDEGDGTFEIAWEGGPHAWTYLFPYGGVDEEATTVARVPDVSDELPSHLFVEAATHYSIHVTLA